MAELNVTLQELRGTYKEFTAKNPILKNGQLAVVTIETGDSVGGFIAPSTGLKCGDGVTAFNDLGWLAGREQLINTGSVASNAILHKQNQELYMTQSEFDKLDKTTLPVGTEINIVDQIQKSDLSTEIQKSLTNADTALTNANTANTTANTALTTANNALPKAGGTISGNLAITGNETLDGALTVSGLTTLNNTTFTADSVIKRVDADGDEIGIVQFRHVYEEAVPFGTFETGYDYRIGDADGVEYYFPEENIPNDLWCVLHFNSGTEATVYYTDDDCVITGDDCKDGVFTPVANKRYTVLVWYDGTKQAIVRGVPTDGQWADDNTSATIGALTDSAPATLKKIIYCKSSDIPSTPETGVEYACTDFIGEADLDTALQTKLSSFATKTDVSAVSTVANNALPKTGGTVTGDVTFCQNTLTVDQGGISVNNGSLTLDGQEVTTQYYVDQEIAKVKSGYDYTFSDLTALKALLAAQTATDSLKGKHILYTGSWDDYGTDQGSAEAEGSLDFHGADVTHEHHYTFTANSGDHIFGDLKNIGTFYGYKWTSVYDDETYPTIGVTAEIVKGLGIGTFAGLTADYIYDAQDVGYCTSKTGTASSPYGTVSNCLLGDNATIANYVSVVNCSTTNAEGKATFNNCTYVGKQLEASQIGSTSSAGKYDYTFSTYDDLTAFLNAYTSTDGLKDKSVLFTGEFDTFGSKNDANTGALDFHGADLTIEHYVDYSSYYCSGSHYCNTLKNIGTLYGAKWTSTHDDWTAYLVTIEADTIRGLGYGVDATITADFIYDAYVYNCTSKTGKTYRAYGTIANCMFNGAATIKNYASIMNCSTTSTTGVVTFQCCDMIGKELKVSQIASSSSTTTASAQWRDSASSATSSNPVQFIKLRCSSYGLNYCSDVVTAEITTGITPYTYGCSASAMAFAPMPNKLYCFILEFATTDRGTIENKSTLSVYEQGSSNPLVMYSKLVDGSWVAQQGGNDLNISAQYYY